jgi:hypothetical protein
MEHAMHGELQLLVRGLEHAVGNNSSAKRQKTAYIAAPWLLPGMPEYIRQFSSGRASTELGFHIEWKCGDADAAFSEIMPVIEAYITPQQREGNMIARRYLRWRLSDNPRA